MRPIRSQPRQSQLLYSTYLGGSSADTTEGLCMHRSGTAVVMGHARSSNFPITNGALSTKKNGTRDAYVAMLDLLPEGTARFGNATPGCAGEEGIGVISDPAVGSSDFAITGFNAHRLQPGLLAVSGQRLNSGFQLGGVELWIDLAQPPVVLLPVTSGPFGAVKIPMPIPNDPLVAGTKVYGQFLWFGATGPSCPLFGMSATQALEIEIQN